MASSHEQAPEDSQDHKFAVMINRVIDKKTGKVQLSMQTRGEGISLAEAAIILEGWVKKVKKELQRPFTDNLVFSTGEKEKK